MEYEMAGKWRIWRAGRFLDQLAELLQHTTYHMTHTTYYPLPTTHYPGTKNFPRGPWPVAVARGY
jgi:hypothetical protein